MFKLDKITQAININQGNKMDPSPVSFKETLIGYEAPITLLKVVLNYRDIFAEQLNIPASSLQALDKFMNYEFALDSASFNSQASKIDVDASKKQFETLLIDICREALSGGAERADVMLFRAFCIGARSIQDINTDLQSTSEATNKIQLISKANSMATSLEFMLERR